ncbi:hypothetical protein CLIB1423_07S04434 [[Candida] railenensis]|uniref:C2H2-type domain-containing protein n=1 Tax=[Candida] railenensis TaxID=45579 RepID=A0A9P0QPR2_9ASCO|nr:hypothetical protein CLIB1423_07S04434 [[Candida] railenensis]
MKRDEQYIPELRKDFLEEPTESQDIPSKQMQIQNPQPLPQLQNPNPNQSQHSHQHQQLSQHQNQHQHLHQLSEIPQQQQPDQNVHQLYQFHQPMQTQNQQQYHMQLPQQQATHIQPTQVSPQLQQRPHPMQQQLSQNQPSQPLSINISNHQLQQQIYPDITTMINNNPEIIPPSVQSTFVDPKICQVCGKRSNDMSRHMRIHDTNPRFSCKFPSSWCNYKSINYKRRYEFKRHLLCKHFKFDVLKMGRKMTVSSVLDHKGRCPCGLHSTARVWLDEHILPGDNISSPCPLFKF